MKGWRCSAMPVAATPTRQAISGHQDRVAAFTFRPRYSRASHHEFTTSFIEGTEHVYRCGYFTRLSTSSTTPPPDPAGLLHFISSPVAVIVRVCSAPIQFGNVLCSILIVKTLSATE
jgi:hypothetical protein